MLNRGFFKIGSILALLFSAILLTACVEASSVAELIQSNALNMNMFLTPTSTPVQIPPQATPEAPTPTPEFPSELLPILFTSNRGGVENSDIYQINPDGSGLIRLTDDPATDKDPVWSPDRNFIAFASDRSGQEQIYILSTTDYEAWQLTNHPGGAVSPTWAPDGGRIAFVEPGAASSAIYIADTLNGNIEITLETNLPGTRNPAWSPRGDNIAFAAVNTSDEDRLDIYSLSADQTVLINLTNHAGNDDCPAWSADGQRLAFQSDRDGNHNIYLMNANGSLQTPLTANPAHEIEPDWSGDGQQIVFSSNENGPYQLNIISENGAEQTALAPTEADDRQPSWSDLQEEISDVLLFTSQKLSTDVNLFTIELSEFQRSQIANLPGEEWSPAWSPDGSQIAFASSLTGNFEIYTIDSAGSQEPKRLTESTSNALHPEWSPDGNEIAFESKQNNTWDIWIMNADGSNARNLTVNEEANDGNPTWSPDGKEIVFSSNRNGSYDLYLMNADGTGEVEQLTELPGDAFHPDFSPDGSLIVFRANVEPGGNKQIFIMDGDGRNLRQLLRSSADDDMPAWSPDGQSIAFISNQSITEDQFGDENFDLFVYDMVTSKLTQVTFDVQEDTRYPTWKPRTVPPSPANPNQSGN